MMVPATLSLVRQAPTRLPHEHDGRIVLPELTPLKVSAPGSNWLAPAATPNNANKVTTPETAIGDPPPKMFACYRCSGG